MNNKIDEHVCGTDSCSPDCNSCTQNFNPLLTKKSTNGFALAIPVTSVNLGSVINSLELRLDITLLEYASQMQFP